MHRAVSVFYLSCLFVVGTICARLSSSCFFGYQHGLYRAGSHIRGHELNWLALHIGDSELRPQPNIQRGHLFGSTQAYRFPCPRKDVIFASGNTSIVCTQWDGKDDGT